MLILISVTLSTANKNHGSRFPWVEMQPRITHRNYRTGRTKLKSGCRTCKIRKIKCDEGYPACSRCVSTGRVCDGYGIWGGGGNFYGYRGQPAVSRDALIFPRPVCVYFLDATTEEKEYFDWFKCRTVVKLPGSFISDFWTTLLLQACLSEAAVLHAVLALSSVHRRGILNVDRQNHNSNVPDKLEQFTLQHYVKAIGHMHPHFLAKDKASFRIALIVCIVFISLEFLRGHFTTAHVHLKNGLQLLREMQLLLGENDELLVLSTCCKATDDWILEAFSRLFIQVKLFKQSYQHPCLLLQTAISVPPATMFCSFKEAWQEIERLIHKVFHLTKQAREHKAERTSLHHSSTLLRYQQGIQAELAGWLNTYKASEKPLRSQISREEEKVYQILHVYHTMVTIMADMCLFPDDEGAFDLRTNQFIYLIRQLADLREFSSFEPPLQSLPGQIIDMSRSIVDMGWIPPLYYVAIKCRVHRIRLQATRLLESSIHREGVWDAQIAACVSRKVMEIEEKDYYKDIKIADDFPLCDSPQSQDLSLPPLPESYRIRDVEVVLLGNPMDKILLLGMQRQDGIDCKVCIGEYHVPSQCWLAGFSK